MQSDLSDLGATLKHVRESNGITVESITKATNISVALLSALERGDLSRWPTGVNGRAYLRQYANRIGLARELAWGLSQRLPEELRRSNAGGAGKAWVGRVYASRHGPAPDADGHISEFPSETPRLHLASRRGEGGVSRSLVEHVGRNRRDAFLPKTERLRVGPSKPDARTGGYGSRLVSAGVVPSFASVLLSRQLSPEATTIETAPVPVAQSTSVGPAAIAPAPGNLPEEAVSGLIDRVLTSADRLEAGPGALRRRVDEPTEAGRDRTSATTKLDEGFGYRAMGTIPLFASTPPPPSAIPAPRLTADDESPYSPPRRLRGSEPSLALTAVGAPAGRLELLLDLDLDERGQPVNAIPVASTASSSIVDAAVTIRDHQKTVVRRGP